MQYVCPRILIQTDRQTGTGRKRNADGYRGTQTEKCTHRERWTDIQTGRLRGRDNQGGEMANQPEIAKWRETEKQGDSQ